MGKQWTEAKHNPVGQVPSPVALSSMSKGLDSSAHLALQPITIILSFLSYSLCEALLGVYLTALTSQTSLDNQ